MLQTARLCLRCFAPEDAPSLSAIWSDAEVFRYLPFDEPRGIEQCRQSIAQMNAHWEKYGYGLWAVTGQTGGAGLGQRHRH